MTNPWNEQQPRPATPPDYPLYNPPTTSYPNQGQPVEPYFPQPGQPMQPAQPLVPNQPPGYFHSGYASPPDNYLVWAILSTIFCFLPLGIVSIVFSSQVNSKWTMGDIYGAQESARKARNFAKWSAIIAGAGWVLYLMLIFVLMAVTVTRF
ncbi:MAG: CD225/dispanin family protein [Propionibacteriaceae bacterium]|jgi:hypothetical protein|nr:CD225/dispanin family protein [Propionibacteriaceae bacterium]